MRNSLRLFCGSQFMLIAAVLVFALTGGLSVAAEPNSIPPSANGETEQEEHEAEHAEERSHRQEREAEHAESRVHAEERERDERERDLIHARHMEERERAVKNELRARLEVQERDVRRLEQMIERAERDGNERIVQELVHQRARALEMLKDAQRAHEMEERDRDDAGNWRERVTMAERELSELEQMIERAERDGNERGVLELTQERDRIRETLEVLGHAHVMEAHEQEEEELDRHRAQLDLQRAELETSFGRLEMVGRIAEISETEVTAAAFAVMHIEQFMEIPEAIEFLQEMLEQSKNEAVRRMIRIRLLELNADQQRHDGVRSQLRYLILGS